MSFRVKDVEGCRIYGGQEDGFVVFSKPSGIRTEDFARLVRRAYPYSPQETVSSPNKFKAYVVHRLDMGTSGCLIFGFTPGVRKLFGLAFEGRRVKKRYLAIVDGTPNQECGIIDAPLTTQNSLNSELFKGQTLIDPNGKPAQTHYEVMASNGEQSLLCLSPITGRTHQLRVHCANILQTPICDDELYNPAAAHSSQPMCLHAWNITVPHPNQEGFSLMLEAPLPRYMKEKVKTMQLTVQAETANL